MKKFRIIILVLIMLLLAGCGKKKEEEAVRVPENRELTSQENDDLMAIVKDLDYLDINPAKSFKTTELANQEVLLWAADLVGDPDGKDFSEFADLADKYLNFSLEPEHILCMTHSNILGTSDYLYLYDVETKKFNYNKDHTNHANEGYYSFVVNRFDSSKMVNDEYVITVYKLFSDTNADFSDPSGITWKKNWYASYSDAKNRNNSLEYDTYDGASYDINEMSTDSLIKYTYTFRLKNGNYVLKSYEIGK